MQKWLAKQTKNFMKIQREAMGYLIELGGPSP
jgi:hypothetical protein